MKSAQLAKLALIATSMMLTQPALAQFKSFGESFAVPHFESIDENGVNWTSGYLRVQSPVITKGRDEAQRRLGLSWVGRSWVRTDTPTIWKKNGKFTVNYNGYSDEFNGPSNFTQRKPVNGASLGCSYETPSNHTSLCVYKSRDGDIVLFRGIPSSLTPVPNNIGESWYEHGNLAITSVEVISADRGNRRHGDFGPYAFAVGRTDYYKRDFILRFVYQFNPSSTLFSSELKITTPNHDNDDEEHYLRPKNTTQTITDYNGNVWKYTFNSDREMTKIDAPGTAADVTFTYTGQHRVRTVTTVDGVWDYSYSDNSTFRTITRTDPEGNVTIVKYHKDGGYVVRHTDPLNRVTNYEYTDDRLTKITYPELNYVTFAYDSRGNLTQKTTYGKPGAGAPVLTETATYPATCDSTPTCNRPISVTDANGNVTNFTYKTPGTVQASLLYGPVNMPFGTNKPETVTLPAPTNGAVRPQIRNSYVGGALVESSICKTQSSCAGTADEVKTVYDYGTTHQDQRLLYGEAVTSNGQTLRTCYSYDFLGRRTSVTTPRAGLASCPTSTNLGSTSGTFSPAFSRAALAPTYPTSSGTGGGTGGGGTGGGDPPDPCINQPVSCQ
ncbi:YD repeat-containing protein [Parasphingorhabdus marina DSM 22363]|uniref:YD repeat-containing protein n=1 Tax=Parasphingorhabdus marina DSM 22363 TaxID=1123272 RepID=A0A1N6HMH2_9SPHN|nr:RHS repeat protein [Parasphingorhabdus marina]SIO20845.1 YD repeat-containing protein [Parasphingorhabdus marina DSM 22363]